MRSLERLRHVIGSRGQGSSVLIDIVEYEPNAVVPARYHLVDCASVVVRGAVEIADEVEQVGSARFRTAGTGYGPLRAGPEGCTIIDVFALGDLEPGVVPAPVC
jgi:hypothetical protein